MYYDPSSDPNRPYYPIPGHSNVCPGCGRCNVCGKPINPHYFPVKPNYYSELNRIEDREVQNIRLSGEWMEIND